jgi:hypothetical protein
VLGLNVSVALTRVTIGEDGLIMVGTRFGPIYTGEAGSVVCRGAYVKEREEEWQWMRGKRVAIQSKGDVVLVVKGCR